MQASSVQQDVGMHHLIADHAMDNLTKHSITALPASFQPNLNLTKEEAVTKLNVTYLMLLRLGFEKSDIEEALQHTYTGESEDALDWVMMSFHSDLTISCVSYRGGKKGSPIFNPRRLILCCYIALYAP